MMHVAFSVILFILTSAAIVFAHRAVLAKGKRTPKVLLLYVFGFFLLVVTYIFFYSIFPDAPTFWTMPLPLSGVTVYVLLSCIGTALCASAILGDRGPTSRILGVFRYRQRCTINELVSLSYSEDPLPMRLSGLEKTHLIISERKRYRATSRAKKILFLIHIYKSIIGVGGYT